MKEWKSIHFVSLKLWLLFLDDKDNDNEAESKAGLADAMAKILAKSVPQYKQVILAKGTTDRELQKKRKKKEEEEDLHEDKTSLEKVMIYHSHFRVSSDSVRHLPTYFSNFIKIS